MVSGEVFQQSVGTIGQIVPHAWRSVFYFSEYFGNYFEAKKWKIGSSFQFTFWYVDVLLHSNARDGDGLHLI